MAVLARKYSLILLAAFSLLAIVYIILYRRWQLWHFWQLQGPGSLTRESIKCTSIAQDMSIAAAFP